VRLLGDARQVAYPGDLRGEFSSASDGRSPHVMHAIAQQQRPVTAIVAGAELGPGLGQHVFEVGPSTALLRQVLGVRSSGE